MYSRIKGIYKGNEIDREYSTTWQAAEYFKALTGTDLNKYFNEALPKRWENSNVEVDQKIDRDGKFRIAICTLKVDDLDIQILQID